MGSVARSIVDAVAVHGATTVFGLPGVHNLAFWKVPEGAPLVVRHEQAAVYAADGWARATGRLGAAVVTTGPGAANALAAFGEAAAARSPVLLVASEIPQALRRAGRLRGVLHESRDQAGLFRPLAKAVFTPRSAADVAGVLDEAVAAAMRHPRGPVYVDVPADVLGHEAVTPLAPGPWFEPLPTEADLDAAAAVLADARVVIWAGGGAVDAEPSVAVLAEHLGAPVVASFGGRGVPPTAHPLTRRAAAARARGGGADRAGRRAAGRRRRPRRHEHPQLDDAAPTPAGHARPGAARRSAGVGGRRDRRRAARRRAARPARPAAEPRAVGAAEPGRAARERIAADPVSAEAMALVAAVEAARTDETVLVCDMAVAGYWVGGYASAPGPRRLAYPVGWGTLGFGLPAAIGPAAAGHPVIAVCGDGGLAMGVGELATLVQERLPVTVLVVDDGGYGMLRYDQARVGDPEVGVDLVGPDFSALAAAFGLPATAVPSAGDGLADALAKAVGSGGPHLVHVRARLTPPRTTSPRWHED